MILIVFNFKFYYNDERGGTMKIRFLGTAAAEGWPAIFCSCPACMKAKELKGKNIRSRFSIMIDDAYKIDFPPDSFYHMIQYQLDYTKLKYLFISHPHTDHLASHEFEFRRKWFTNLRNDRNLHIYGWTKSLTKIKKGMVYSDENEPIYHSLKAFKKIETPDFDVYPLPANHMTPKDKPFIYLFVRKSDQKTFLSAHDTGYFFDEVWDFLKSFHIDVISLDCTHGGGSSLNNHLGHQEVLKVKQKLEELHIFNEGFFIVNHFSHNGKWSHEELESFFKPYHILVAYDGMEIEF